MRHIQIFIPGKGITLHLLSLSLFGSMTPDRAQKNIPESLYSPWICTIFIAEYQSLLYYSWQNPLNSIVMKSRSSFSVFLILAWIILFANFNLKSYAQEEIAIAGTNNEEPTLKMPKAIMLNDTVLPTICNSGQGLLHCDHSFQKDHEGVYHAVHQDGGNYITIMEDDLTESELKILKAQKSLISEQYQFQIQQQMRKDRMELGLGELIKGFYMKPLF